MSLLSGMNNMLENKIAMEAADDMELFEEEFALEADEMIDVMVDGADDIEAMEEEYEEEEELNDELDDEDNSIASASEAAALTGQSFLNSLNVDNNDPIKTSAGSIGSDDGTANHKDNFSDESADNNDPIKTKPGSQGQQDSAATFDKNYSDSSLDHNDPIKTTTGSIGQKNSTAKDPAVESYNFFHTLMGDIAEEGVVDKAKDFAQKRTQEKTDAKRAKRQENCNLAGVPMRDDAKLSNLLDNGNYDAALKLAEAYGNKLESAKGSISEDDPDTDKKIKAINTLLKENANILVKIQKDKKVAEKRAAGKDKKEAVKEADIEMRNAAKNLSPATEAIILHALDCAKAFEEATDPELTEDGSIGQKDSAATNEKNFSDGSPDNNDPIKPKDGSEGQEDSAATFDKNYSDGALDNNDPIDTEDGSVGQKDSTAKDPAAESAMDIDAELAALTESLLDDFDDDDDL